jgi:hypothetical protein
MTEYEWETERLPKAPDARWLPGYRPRKGPLAEYALLEFPRESVTWVARGSGGREEDPARTAGSEGAGITKKKRP